MATPAQQSSPATALPMLVTKRTPSPSITSHPPFSIPKHNVLIIGGDMNAKIGKNVNNKFSLHNSSNKNGEHLTDLTLELALILNFRKEREKFSPTQINAKAQIDSILINKKWNYSTLNCEAYFPLSRVCPSITGLSLQRYDWAYE